MPSEGRVESRIAKALSTAALQIPGTTTGIACAGTTLESKTYLAGKKAFVFIGEKEARLKLAESVSEAQDLAQQLPDWVRVGSGGWVSIRVNGDVGPPAKTLTKWVKESHALLAPSSPARKRSTTKKS